MELGLLLSASQRPMGYSTEGTVTSRAPGHGRKGQAEPSLGSCLPSRRSAQRRHKG